MPAAAVIPAPIAYIKVVAVKKLVVECRAWRGRFGLTPHGVQYWSSFFVRSLLLLIGGQNLLGN